MKNRDDDIRYKKERLFQYLSGLPSLAVGFSGGVDSTLLLAASRQVLGDRVVAMTARSATHPQKELEFAVEMAKRIGVEHTVFDTAEMLDSAFTSNGPERCYHCKKKMFEAMHNAALEKGIHTLAHGANIDDLSDYRPGFRAAEEMGVLAPLSEAGLTKADVRQIARTLGLPNWDRPAMACMATRIPYGVTIEHQVLLQIEKAESLVLEMGVGSCRVRHHGNLARIEIDPEDMDKLTASDVREKLAGQFRAIGYDYVCLDLEGYISGKMNREL